MASFSSLVASIPGWEASLEELNRQIALRQIELTRLEDHEHLPTRSLKNKSPDILVKAVRRLYNLKNCNKHADGLTGLAGLATVMNNTSDESPASNGNDGLELWHCSNAKDGSP
jgi:hypothetical protein